MEAPTPNTDEAHSPDTDVPEQLELPFRAQIGAAMLRGRARFEEGETYTASPTRPESSSSPLGMSPGALRALTLAQDAEVKRLTRETYGRGN